MGATEDENIVGMGHTISQSSYSREQRLSLCEINGKHSEMISDSFKFRSASGVRSQEQFLKHNWVHCKTNAAFVLGRE